MAEGPDRVLICYQCVEKCARVIEAQFREPGKTLDFTAFKCIIPGCREHATAHFCIAEQRRVVQVGHVCEQHGPRLLHDYLSSAYPAPGIPSAHEKGVSFDPGLVFLHDARDRRGATGMLSLVETGGTRRFGIGIGPYEGAALLIELQRQPSQQAVTHRGMLAVISALGSNLDIVVIDSTAMGEQIGYVGELWIRIAGKRAVIQVSAIDAVLLAVIGNIPVIVSDKVLKTLDKSDQ